MIKNKEKYLLKEILSTAVLFIIGNASILFTSLYVNTFNTPYETLIISLTDAFICVLTVLSVAFLVRNKTFIYKICFLFILTVFFISLFLYLFKISGMLVKFKSVEDFRLYIQSFNNLAVILFLLIQFLQVVILPIPSFITVGAGVLLFGALKGAILSVIGIVIGSIVAFFIGRVFGLKVVKWLIGEETLKKGLKYIKGKDKVLLTFMFLFPFFPDDVLCFVAGITTIDKKFFIVMIIITRIITIFISSFSMNNNLIPYDKWWGILIWAILFIATILLSTFICKKGEEIEKFIKSKKRKSQ